MKADPKIADLLAENKRLRETIKRLEGMSVPTREEFDESIGAYCNALINYENDPSRSCGADIDVAERGLTAAYDAALARIAELESPAHRARIAREFLGELTFRYTDIDLDKSAFDCFLAVLDEWEAAAKEGV